MSNTKQVITDSEYEVMKVLWQAEKKLTVGEITLCLSESGWADSTVSTFLQRLLKKGVISCEKKGKKNLYYPILKQSEYSLDQTQSLISRIYNGSAKSLVAALFREKKLSREDISELKKMFELE